MMAEDPAGRIFTDGAGGFAPDVPERLSKRDCLDMARRSLRVCPASAARELWHDRSARNRLALRVVRAELRCPAMRQRSSDQ
jgi:hypothetical protein